MCIELVKPTRRGWHLPRLCDGVFVVEQCRGGLVVRVTNESEYIKHIYKRRWVEGLGLELLAHAITVLDIDVVLVMKHDRLYADMVATLPRSVAVINLPRSGGVY